MSELVCNIKLGIIQCFSDRNIRIILIYLKQSNENGSLCRAISIYKGITLWRFTRNKLLSSYGKIFQALAFHLKCKLSSYLCGHKGMGNAVLIKITLKSKEIQTDLFRNNMKLCTVCNGSVNIHHRSIKTKGCISCYPGIRIYTIILSVPAAECSDISIFNHTALWHTCGT